MAVICASWIYSASQVLIYSALDISLSVVRSVALLAACVLFSWGLLRSRFLNVDVYLSYATIQYSLTALLASAYLLVLGLLAYQVRFFNLERPLPSMPCLCSLRLPDWEFCCSRTGRRSGSSALSYGTSSGPSTTTGRRGWN